jgi:hypothetical protein
MRSQTQFWVRMQPQNLWNWSLWHWKGMKGFWMAESLSTLQETRIESEILGSHGASMKMTAAFWDVAPCSLEVDRRFRASCCFHRPNETSVFFHEVTRSYIYQKAVVFKSLKLYSHWQCDNNIFAHLFMSWGSSVSIVSWPQSWRLGDRGSIPGRG